ncbi:DUF2798 domain-containing protein [Acetobacterium bakii]|uniref:DUF2798 domain-containing protein n=1 Tax=Acetobacterium bakii TaxID=52689 RepID=A0A0L6TXB5_9FIRM|nr:DUF2798 domain-containing protein [Acetobacterium bakii]KNZ40904.1 hypothetical protein AKG39_15155 [Acetobacterium bakii]
MNSKQNFFFTLTYSIFISIVLTFFMTAVFVGFTDGFSEAYLSGVVISIVVSTVLSFLVSPILERTILKDQDITKIRMMVFNFLLAIALTAGVTFCILLLSSGLFPGFLVHWLKTWLVAAVMCFILIELTVERFQQLTVSVIK